MSHLCYIDESGCLGALPAANSGVQPVFALIGLIVPAERLVSITHGLIKLKQRFNPQNFHNRNYLESILPEIKGKNLRNDLKSSRHKKRRTVLAFIDGVIRLLEVSPQVRIVGRVWIKPVGKPFDGRSIYTSSVQCVASYFQAFLTKNMSYGVMACDSRNHGLNSQVAHSIFTQKFGKKQIDLSHIQDLPFFADSRNHAGIQLADIVCSTIIAPLAAGVYCSSSSVAPGFVHPNYLQLRKSFGKRLERLQYRYTENSGKRTGGIVVSDPNRKHSGHLFQ